VRITDISSGYPVNIHGGDLHRASRKTGIPVEGILDFSASINPLGIPRKAEQAIQDALRHIHHYPDTDAHKLREEIGRFHGIDPDSIICGNGSTELIYLIPRALRPSRVLIPAPTFTEYERAVIRAQKTDDRVQIRYLFLKEANGFRINTDDFIDAMQGCDMAFLCNPNNPTGTLLSREEVLRTAESAKENGCFLVVDEAFIDFVPHESVIKEVSHNPYLIVLRSMTKFYALTGLRLGYGVFHQDVTERIRSYKEPWTVNTPAQEAGIAVLRDSTYAKETRELIRQEKRFIEDALAKMGIRFFPSAANYYLLKLEETETVVKEMMKDGILIRHCTDFRGLDSSYVRIAVRTRKENERLIQALHALLRVS
jgi:threonine-phosphate decarboxylase